MPVVERAGFPINYEVIDLVLPWRTKPETILLHHGLAMRKEAWYGWLPRLIDRYRILLFDIRGHGRSGPIRAADQVNLETFAADALAVADAEGAHTFHFVGESLGGTVGLYLGLHHSDRLRGLVVTNAAHIGTSIKATDDFAATLAQRGMTAWSAGMMEGRFFVESTDPALLRWYEREQAAITPETVLAIRDLLVDTDIAAGVSKIDRPVLLFNGDSSPFISVEAMAQLHAQLPRSQLRIIPRARHGLPVSHADECAAAARDFFDDLDAGT